ncbi:tRNA (adenosine(37)-N6)-threonylcarbamoyltransferase complex dimerization subunit type 1 TsaB [Elusimicrobiota bacterium]
MSGLSAVVVETSGNMASAAIYIKGKCVAELNKDAALKHENALWNFFDKASGKVRKTRFDFIAATRGPGRFTGVRLALGIANTLAWARKAPVFAPSTLDLMSWKAVHNSKGLASVGSLMAFGGLVYAGLYKKSARAGMIKIRNEKSYKNIEDALKDICGKSGCRDVEVAFYGDKKAMERVRASDAAVREITPDSKNLFDMAMGSFKNRRSRGNDWYVKLFPKPLYLKQTWQ